MFSAPPYDHFNPIDQDVKYTLGVEGRSSLPKLPHLIFMSRTRLFGRNGCAALNNICAFNNVLWKIFLNLINQCKPLVKTKINTEKKTGSIAS